MADHEFDVPWTPPKLAPDKDIKVAVVGAGPCGLTAALRLAQRGYQVTVFERMPLPGGMMTYGIPAYRLPREALFAEIDHIWRAGVRVPLQHGAGHRFHDQEPARTTATRPSCWRSARTAAATWASTAKTSRASTTPCRCCATSPSGSRPT